MTKDQFIQHAKTFPEGTMAVVSGKDVDEIELMLIDAMDAIEADTSKQSLVFNSRSEVVYPQRFYLINSLEARLWEFVALSSEDAFVVLIANEFDRNDPEQNRSPQTVEIDTVMDLMTGQKVETIMSSKSRHRGGPTPKGVRELFPHISRIYYFDTDAGEITFIKSQTPDRP